MKIYLQFYRLYLVWFSVTNIAGIWLFLSLPVFSVILLIKVIFYAGVYYLAAPSVKKYFCYFQNLGYSALTLFIRVALLDLIAFLLIISTINLLSSNVTD